METLEHNVEQIMAGGAGTNTGSRLFQDNVRAGEPVHRGSSSIPWLWVGVGLTVVVGAVMLWRGRSTAASKRQHIL